MVHGQERMLQCLSGRGLVGGVKAQHQRQQRNILLAVHLGYKVGVAMVTNPSNVTKCTFLRLLRILF